MIDFLKNFYDDFLYRFSPKYIYQKITRGFTDRDLRRLDRNLAILIYSRIKEFSKLKCVDYCSVPVNYKYMTLWRRDIRKIEFAFEKLSDTSQNWLDADKYFQKIKDSDDSMDSEKWVKIVKTRRNYIEKCLVIFGRNFSNLWI